ncbi:MAG TPA: sulfide/dihydroorotate dehydrogenase-like FAD/NAD-binding protein [Candidatus Marinimicrobia bacterium]|nr:sulfide/dihydroorotate dehydrogenase-like FAD/NAD-binding protein [Candidatus Neomarinimicrobiota bacterium]
MPLNKIVKTELLGPEVKLFEITAPRIAKKRKAGQFIILRVDDHGERIPLTIADADAEKGTITVIVQGLGATSKRFLQKEAGDIVWDLAGPLGKPTHIEKRGLVIAVSGGVGTAVAMPIAAASKKAGNTVYSIIGARTKELVILEKEMTERTDKIFITTDDGSYGRKGLVTDQLKSLLDDGIIPDELVAIGPLPMMRAVSELTRSYNIPTVVSLNSIMIDGTGMCGGCRATVDGKTVFVCVDGPEFDGHKVDFAELGRRQKAYLEQEKQSMEAFSHQCRLEVKAKKLKIETA